MAIISINIDKEIREEMKHIKIHVSSVCQEAIRKELSNKRSQLGLVSNQKYKDKIMKEKIDYEKSPQNIAIQYAHSLAEKEELEYEDFISGSVNTITIRKQKLIENSFKKEIKSGVPIKQLISGFIIGVNQVRKELNIELD